MSKHDDIDFEVRPIEDFDQAARRMEREDRAATQREAARRNVAQAPPPAPSLDATYGLVGANTVIEETVEWYWEPFLARGIFTFLEGNPDVGKTTLALTVVAALTRGTVPTGAKSTLPPGNVLYLTAEDSLSATIVPRLRAAGADLSRVILQEARGAELLLPNGVTDLRAIITEKKIALVVLDPFNSYLDANECNINVEQDVRRALRPLRQLAEEMKIMVLALRHLNKKEDVDALFRGSGSIALLAMARSVMLMGRHPDDPELRVILSHKCNLVADGRKPKLGFKIVSDLQGRPVVAWAREQVNIDANTLLGGKKRGPAPEVSTKAESYLRDLLQAPRMRAEVLEMALAAGFTESAISRASRTLGVVSTARGKEREWSLPEGGEREQ